MRGTLGSTVDTCGTGESILPPRERRYYKDRIGGWGGGEGWAERELALQHPCQVSGFEEVGVPHPFVYMPLTLDGDARASMLAL